MLKKNEIEELKHKTADNYGYIKAIDENLWNLKQKVDALNDTINQIRNWKYGITNMMRRNDENYNATIKEMDKYKYRLTQITKDGEIHHYFTEGSEKELIKLIIRCNMDKISYELNERATNLKNQKLQELIYEENLTQWGLNFNSKLKKGK